MSNLIVPLQKYLLGSYSFVPANLRLEFTERVGNLCAHSGTPMTPQLRSWVERTFGIEMVGVIQDFSTWGDTKLSPSMREAIRRVMPNTFDGTEMPLEFIGLFDKNCCPAICDTVASADDLPDPPTGCEFILVYDDIDPRYAAALYYYDAIKGWLYHADFNTVKESNGTFIGFEYEGLDGWQVIVNGVSYTGQAFITFDNPVYYIEVEFISPEGCRYTVDPFGEVPCAWYWDEFDISAGFFIYPEGGAGVLISSNLDIQALQLTYPYLSVFYNSPVTGFERPILIYAPESVVQNWEIDYGSGQVPMTWLPTLPACPVQEFVCYEFTLDIDLTTYPDAILLNILPPGIIGTAAPISSNVLTDEANLELSLNEYLSSVFGGVITTNASYDGTTYTIQVYNVPFYLTSPRLTLNDMTVERDPLDYVAMNKTDITCP